MPRIARYAKATAKPGQGARLAELLLRVAAQAHDEPGCELYVVNHALDDPDTVWVTEVWRTKEAMDASLDAAREAGAIEEVLGLLDGPGELIELVPLGGKGIA